MVMHRKKRSVEFDLVLPWEPLALLMQRVLIDKTLNCEYMLQDQRSKLMVMMVMEARKYFPMTATREILDLFRPLLCPVDTSLHRGMAMLSIFLPVHKFKARAAACCREGETPEQYDWIPEMITIWDWCAGETSEAYFFRLFAHLAKNNVGEIDWTPYFPRIFALFLSYFRLKLSAEDGVMPNTHRIGLSSDSTSDFQLPGWEGLIPNVSQFLIYALLPSNRSVWFAHLRHLVACMEPYVHPSDLSSQTLIIVLFIKSLSATFLSRVVSELGWGIDSDKNDYVSNIKEALRCAVISIDTSSDEEDEEENEEENEEDDGKQEGDDTTGDRVADKTRYPQELYLNKSDHTELVNMLMPLVKRGLFSKSANVRRQCYGAVAYLCTVMPEVVMPQMLRMTLPALTTVTMSHQVAPALSVMMVVIPHLYSAHYGWPIGIRLLAPMLSLSLPGLDINDKFKTIQTLSMYHCLVGCMPIFGAAPDERDRVTVVDDGGQVPVFKVGSRTVPIIDPGHRPAMLPFFKTSNGYFDPFNSTLNSTPEFKSDGKEFKASAATDDIAQLAMLCDEGLSMSVKMGWNWGTMTDTGPSDADGDGDDVSYAMKPISAQEWIDTAYELMPEIAAWVEEVVVRCWQLMSNMVVKKNDNTKEQTPLGGMMKTGLEHRIKSLDPCAVMIRVFIARLSRSICDVKFRIRLAERVVDLMLETPPSDSIKYCAWLCGSLVQQCEASAEVFIRTLIPRIMTIIHDNDMTVERSDLVFVNLIWYLRVLSKVSAFPSLIKKYYDSYIQILDVTLACPVEDVQSTACKLLRCIVSSSIDFVIDIRGNVSPALANDPNFHGISVLYWGRNVAFGDARSAFRLQAPEHIMLGLDILKRYLYGSVLNIEKALVNKNVNTPQLLASLSTLDSCIRGYGLACYTRDDTESPVVFSQELGWSPSHNNAKMLWMYNTEDVSHPIPNVYPKTPGMLDMISKSMPLESNFVSEINNLRVQVSEALVNIGNMLLGAESELSKPLKSWLSCTSNYLHHYSNIERKARSLKAGFGSNIQLLARRRLAPRSAVVLKIDVDSVRRFKFGSMSKFFEAPVTTLADLVWRACLYQYSEVRCKAQDVLTRISYRFRCEQDILCRCLKIIANPNSKENELTGAMYTACSAPMVVHMRLTPSSHYEFMKVILTAKHITRDTQVARLHALPVIVGSEALEFAFGLVNSHKFNVLSDKSSLMSFGTCSSLSHLINLDEIERMPKYGESIGLALSDTLNKLLVTPFNHPIIEASHKSSVNYVLEHRKTVVEAITGLLDALNDPSVHWKLQVFGLAAVGQYIQIVHHNNRYSNLIPENVMSKLLKYVLPLLTSVITPARASGKLLLTMMLDWCKPERDRIVRERRAAHERYSPNPGQRTTEQIDKFVKCIPNVPMSSDVLEPSMDDPTPLYKELPSQSVLVDRMNSTTWPLPTTSDEWANATFTDRNSFGYNGIPPRYFAYNSGNVNEMRLTPCARQALMEQFSDSSFIEKLLTMPMDAQESQIKFADHTCTMFKGFAKIAGLPLYKLFHPVAVKLLAQKDTIEQNAEIIFCSVCELFAGFYRGTKHWSFDDTMEFNRMVLPVLRDMLISIQGTGRVDMYYSMIHYVSYDRDMRRLAWLMSMLVNVMSEQESPFDMYKTLAVLSPMVTEASWRAPTLRSLLLEQAKGQFVTPFTKLRESYGHLIGHYLISSTIPKYDRGALRTGQPCVISSSVSRLFDYIIGKLDAIERDEERHLNLDDHQNNGDSDDNDEDVSEDPATLFRKAVLSILMVLFLRSPSHQLQEVFVKMMPHIIRMARPTAMREKNMRLAVRVALVCGARIPYDRWLIDDVVDVCISASRSTIWHERKHLLLFLQHFLFSQSIMGYVSPQARDRESSVCSPAFTRPFEREGSVFLGHCYSLVVEMLCDSNVEIRSMAMETLAGVSRSAAPATNAALRKNILERADTSAVVCHVIKARVSASGDGSGGRDRYWGSSATPSKRTRTTNGEFLKLYGPLLSGLTIDSILERLDCHTGAIDDVSIDMSSVITGHAGVLGLCALVLAVPRDVPPHLPGVLMRLTAHLDDPAPIPFTVRKTLKEFWHTHQDEWELHKHKFTEDQLELLSGLLFAPVHFV